MKKQFNPLVFLSAVGAGGISIAPFVYFQYQVPHAKGLTTAAQVPLDSVAPLTKGFYLGLESIMILFASLHIILSLYLLPKLFKWYKEGGHKELVKNPLANPAMLAPFLSLAMSFNVMIAVVRFFVPALHENLQTIMGPALVAWIALTTFVLWLSAKLLKTAFVGDFDIHKIHFGWMLYPFTLAMVGVTGTGYAALSKSSLIAGTAAFLSTLVLTAAVFLLLVKLFAIFSSHYKSKGLPEKQFLPSVLSVVPIMTLLGIAGYRLTHYLHNHMHIEAGSLGKVIVIVAFAFQTWYMIFGLSFLKDYLKGDFLKKEYYVSQWALICPFVAYAVLGTFASKVMGGNTIVAVVAMSAVPVAIGAYMLVLKRMLVCSGILKGSQENGGAYSCS